MRGLREHRRWQPRMAWLYLQCRVGSVHRGASQCRRVDPRHAWIAGTSALAATHGVALLAVPRRLNTPWREPVPPSRSTPCVDSGNIGAGSHAWRGSTSSAVSAQYTVARAHAAEEIRAMRGWREHRHRSVASVDPRHAWIAGTSALAATHGVALLAVPRRLNTPWREPVPLSSSTPCVDCGNIGAGSHAWRGSTGSAASAQYTVARAGAAE